MPLRILPYLALLLTALCLIPAGAHLFELPNKLALDRAAYFTVQGIYRGWALFGIALVGALIADAALAVTARRHRPAAFPWALTGTLLMIADLVIFFVWVFPTNQATANWTIAPDDWEALRHRWEYGHAAGALAAAAAFAAIGWAVLEWRD